MLTKRTRQCFPNTYPCILGRVFRPEECWKFQRLVEVVEYLAASSDYFRLSHWFWWHSGGVLCAFISRQDAFKAGEAGPHGLQMKRPHDHWWLLYFSNEQWLLGCIQLARHQVHYSTSFLDLGGTRNSFWKWRFKVPDMKPEFFPLGSFTRWIISQVLVSGLKTEY